MPLLPRPPMTTIDREKRKQELVTLLDKVPTKDYFAYMWGDILDIKETQTDVCNFIEKIYTVCPELNNAICEDGIHCGEHDKESKEVKIIKAKSKMYMKLSKYWGYIFVGVVASILGAIAGYIR